MVTYRPACSMPVLRLQDADDPRLARFHNVRDAVLLETHGVFVAEGRLVVERIVRDGRHRIEQVLLSGAAYEALRPVLSSREDLDIWIVDRPAAFESITGFNIHRGCLALVRRPAPIDWQAATDGVRLSIALEAVSDADNVGSVFRNAAAFGAGAVLLSPTCCDPLYRKAVRTSMAASTRVPFARVHEWPGALHEMRQHGVLVAALTPRQPGETLDTVAPRIAGMRVVLVVGTEGAGLSDEVERLANTRVRIPMCEGVDSVNLAVATGIALSRLSGLH